MHWQTRIKRSVSAAVNMVNPLGSFIVLRKPVELSKE
jgi:hypothetical protein